MCVNDTTVYSLHLSGTDDINAEWCNSGTVKLKQTNSQWPVIIIIILCIVYSAGQIGTVQTDLEMVVDTSFE